MELDRDVLRRMDKIDSLQMAEDVFNTLDDLQRSVLKNYQSGDIQQIIFEVLNDAMRAVDIYRLKPSRRWG